MYENYKYIPTIDDTVPYQELPTLPLELEAPLYSAFCRYQNFIGVATDEFSEEELEQDKQKYSHLTHQSTDDGTPIFCERKCVEYMHIYSGANKKLCATFLYLDSVALVQGGFIQDEDSLEEVIVGDYKITLHIIDEIETNGHCLLS